MSSREKGWCSPCWIVLHAIADAYPSHPNNTDRVLAIRFLDSLKYMLPCETCNEHLRDFIKYHPPALDSNWHFKRWMCDLHNAVNARLGKRQLTYKESERKQRQLRTLDVGAVLDSANNKKDKSMRCNERLSWILFGAALAYGIHMLWQSCRPQHSN